MANATKLDEFRNAANEGNPDAQYHLGICYAEGKLVPKDYSIAAEYFYSALKQNHPGAKSNFDWIFDRLDSPQPNLLLYEQYGEFGYAKAQWCLGNLYLTGTQVEKNLRTAFEWYLKAAKQNYTDALLSIGCCYADGAGVCVDYLKAIDWLSQPALQFNQLAIAKLEYCHLQINLQKLDDAKEWFRKSSLIEVCLVAKQKKIKEKKNAKIFSSEVFKGDHLPLDRSSNIKVQMDCCTFIGENIFSQISYITELHLFIPIFHSFSTENFVSSLQHLKALRTFVWIDNSSHIHTQACSSLLSFVSSSETLKHFVFHCKSAPKLLRLLEDHQTAFSLDTFQASDPTFSIDDISGLAKFIQINNMKIGIHGFSSEDLAMKLISSLSSIRGTIRSYLWIEYRKSRESKVIERFCGNLHHILRAVALRATRFPFQRPSDYEYCLLAKLCYKDDYYLMYSPVEYYFWLAICGWKILSQYSGKGGYRATVFANTTKRQIVIASRGTKVNNIGALLDDFAGVMLNEEVSHYKSAKNLLFSMLTGKFFKDLSNFDDNISFVPRSTCGLYNKTEPLPIEAVSHLDYQLSFTGHSLGAWLSDILVIESCLFGYRTSSVTFDSPGSKKFVAQMCTNKEITIDVDQLDITTYLSAPNLVNLCNEQLGDVQCIMCERLYSKFLPSLKAVKVNKWLRLTGMIHNVTNFISVGSEDSGEILAVPIIGYWPTCSLVTANHGLNFFLEYLNYAKELMARTKQSPLLTKNVICEAIEKISTTQEPILQFTTGFNTVLLSRLLPQSQKLLQLYEKYKNEEEIKTIIEESMKKDKIYEVLSQYSEIVWSNRRAISTLADCIILYPPVTSTSPPQVPNISGSNSNQAISALDFINKLNYLSNSKEGMELVETLKKFTEMNKINLSVNEKLAKYITFLKEVLENNEYLEKLMKEHKEREITSNYSINKNKYFEDSDKEDTSLETIVEDVKKWIINYENDCCLLFMNLHKRLSNFFERLIKKKLNQVYQGKYAIIVYASWARKCQLPYSNFKFAIILENEKLLTEKIDLNDFIDQIVNELKSSDESEAPDPSNIKSIRINKKDIIFGSPTELFKRFILQKQSSTQNSDNKNTGNNQNTSNVIAVSEKHLFNLVSAWDSNYLFGDKELANKFRNIINSVIQSRETHTNQPRSQLLVQSFLGFVKNTVKFYSEQQNRKQIHEIEELDVHQVYLHCVMIINFLALYYHVDFQHPWDAIDKLLKIGIIARENCDQLKVILSTILLILLKAQLFYHSDRSVIYSPIYDNKNYQSNQSSNINDIEEDELANNDHPFGSEASNNSKDWNEQGNSEFNRKTRKLTLSSNNTATLTLKRSFDFNKIKQKKEEDDKKRDRKKYYVTLMEWEILYYTINKFLIEFGNLLFSFTLWLETTNSDTNPLLKRLDSLEIAKYYYLNAKKYSFDDWKVCLEYSESAKLQLSLHQHSQSQLYHDINDLFQLSQKNSEIECSLESLLVEVVSNLISETRSRGRTRSDTSDATGGIRASGNINYLINSSLSDILYQQILRLLSIHFLMNAKVNIINSSLNISTNELLEINDKLNTLIQSQWNPNYSPFSKSKKNLLGQFILFLLLNNNVEETRKCFVKLLLQLLQNSQSTNPTTQGNNYEYFNQLRSSGSYPITPPASNQRESLTSSSGMMQSSDFDTSSRNSSSTILSIIYKSTQDLTYLFQSVFKKNQIYVSLNVQLLEEMNTIPMDRSGIRYSTLNENTEFNQLFYDISAPMNKINEIFHSNQTDSKFVTIQWISPALGDFNFKFHKNNKRNSQITTRILNKFYENQLFTRPSLDIKSNTESPPNSAANPPSGGFFKHTTSSTPSSSLDTQPLLFKLMDESDKIIANCLFYPNYPSIQFSENTLSRLVSGCSQQGCLVKFNVIENHKVCKSYPAWISRPIIGLPVNKMEERLLQTSVCPFYFTLKIFEFLILNVKYVSPDHLILCPFLDHLGVEKFRFYLLDSHRPPPEFISSMKQGPFLIALFRSFLSSLFFSFFLRSFFPLYSPSSSISLFSILLSSSALVSFPFQPFPCFFYPLSLSPFTFSIPTSFPFTVFPFFLLLSLLLYRSTDKKLAGLPQTGSKSKKQKNQNQGGTGNNEKEQGGSGSGSGHNIPIISYIFCSEQMKSTLHPEACELFKSLDGYSILLEWLGILIDNQKHLADYQFFKTCLFSKEEQINLLKNDIRTKRLPTSIPLQFSSEKVIKIYNRIIKIQEVIEKSPSCTHLELLNHLGYSYLSHYYTKLINNHKSINNRWLVLHSKKRATSLSKRRLEKKSSSKSSNMAMLLPRNKSLDAKNGHAKEDKLLRNILSNNVFGPSEALAKLDRHKSGHSFLNINSAVSSQSSTQSNQTPSGNAGTSPGATTTIFF